MNIHSPASPPQHSLSTLFNASKIRGVWGHSFPENLETRFLPFWGLTWLWIYCIYMVIDWLCIHCIFLQVLDVSCFNFEGSIERPNAPSPHPPRSASATVQSNLHYKYPWGWGHTRGVSPRPSNPDPVWSQEPNRLLLKYNLKYNCSSRYPV